jgi:diguanylate cyclase
VDYHRRIHTVTKVEIDWKNKYKAAALDLDKLEKSQNNDQLRLAVSHLTLGLQGQSTDLDRELKALRSAMKAEADIGSLKSRRMITNIEKHIRKLDGAREDTTQSVLKAVLNWIYQLKSQVDLNSKESDSLSEFEVSAPESVEKLYLLPRLIQNLVALQASVLASAKADLTTAHSQLAVDTDFSLIGTELIQLIGVLNLTREGRQQADVLVARIEKGLAFDVLLEILASVVELAQLAATTSNEDFENYLINLNTQLVEVQGFLHESHTAQAMAGSAHKQLDLQVRNDVSTISKAVKDSLDLGELKLSVSSQLGGIVRAMDVFKRNEEERDSRLQTRYDALMQHVVEMEEEAGRVQAHMEEERLKARTDTLTGLPNRAAYDDHLNKEFNRWVRYRQGFSVAIGDLDFFKRINDTYGHLAGDKVLRLISRILLKHLRGADFVARFGGEEFVILMPSTEVEDGAKAMDKLRESVSASPFNFHGQPVTITMSFGVTQIRESDTKDALFDRADAALYKAKQAGRNRICIG